MSEEKPDTPIEWDDAPEWSDEMFDRAEISVGGKVIRPATGTLTRAGRSPLGTAAKQQVTLQLDPDVVEKFRADKPG
ncbi:BrnA antitoxin family protein [Sphingomonas montana]|uniref:BrnA antitoxin family protein n=1 Tax=Sphingomonas montana TaxID=1843236 RepID=UPI00096FC2CF|nr:BrnA antitoxin family protein [Sphingomonas montana]